MSRWIDDEGAAATLIGRFRGWVACNSRGDVAGLEEFLHPDFVYISAFGRRYDRAGYLALVAGLEPGGVYDIHRGTVRVHGDVALLDGDYFTRSITREGDDLSAHTRFTAVWTREHDAWRCVSQQGTSYDPADGR